MKVEGVITVVACLMVAFFLGRGYQYNSTRDQYQMNTKLEQCEKSLPRDKHCEIVVTAQIKEG